MFGEYITLTGTIHRIGGFSGEYRHEVVFTIDNDPRVFRLKVNTYFINEKDSDTRQFAVHFALTKPGDRVEFDLGDDGKVPRFLNKTIRDEEASLRAQGITGKMLEPPPVLPLFKLAYRLHPDGLRSDESVPVFLEGYEAKLRYEFFDSPPSSCHFQFTTEGKHAGPAFVIHSDGTSHRYYGGEQWENKKRFKLSLGRLIRDTYAALSRCASATVDVPGNEDGTLTNEKRLF